MAPLLGQYCKWSMLYLNPGLVSVWVRNKQRDWTSSSWEQGSRRAGYAGILTLRISTRTNWHNKKPLGCIGACKLVFIHTAHQSPVKCGQRNAARYPIRRKKNQSTGAPSHSSQILPPRRSDCSSRRRRRSPRPRVGQPATNIWLRVPFTNHPSPPPFLLSFQPQRTKENSRNLSFKSVHGGRLPVPEASVRACLCCTVSSPVIPTATVGGPVRGHRPQPHAAPYTARSCCGWDSRGTSRAAAPCRPNWTLLPPWAFRVCSLQQQRSYHDCIELSQVNKISMRLSLSAQAAPWFHFHRLRPGLTS
jgi:hypothetical protein